MSSAPGADEELRDLERLLARVGLGDEQLVDVDADPAGVLRIHRVLRVDEGADAAAPLRLRHHVVDERRLAQGLRAEDLDDPATWQPADAERHVESERAGGDRADEHLRAIAHAHDRALSELSLDLTQCDIERFLAFHLILPTFDSLTNTIPGPRIAPLTGADVKGKQRRRMERTASISGTGGSSRGRSRKRRTVTCGSQPRRSRS